MTKRQSKLLSNDKIALLFTNHNDGDYNSRLYFENLGITAAAGYGNVFNGEITGIKQA